MAAALIRTDEQRLALVAAAGEGDASAVLVLAAEEGLLDTMQLLLEADPEATMMDIKSHGWCPALMVAAEVGRMPTRTHRESRPLVRGGQGVAATCSPCSPCSRGGRAISAPHPRHTRAHSTHTARTPRPRPTPCSKRPAHTDAMQGGHVDAMRLLDHPSADAAAMLVPYSSVMQLHTSHYHSTALIVAAKAGRATAAQLLLDHPSATAAMLTMTDGSGD
jgi:hypothetical protein